MNYLMGIDLGNSGARAAIYDTAGNYIAGNVEVIECRTTSDGKAVLDAKWFCDTVLGIIRKTVKESGVTPEAIKGLSFCTCGNRVAGIDKEGNYPFGIIDFADYRCKVMQEELPERLTEAGMPLNEYVQMMGVQPGGYNALLLFLKKNEPEKYQSVVKWSVTHSAPVIHALCGVFGDPLSLGKSCGIYNQFTGVFDERSSRAFELCSEQISNIQMAGTVFGEVTESAAEKTGLAVGTKVVSGELDAMAQMYALGVADSSEALFSLGTWGSVTMYGDPDLGIPGVFPVGKDNVGWRLLATTPGTGSAVKWLREGFRADIDVEIANTGVDAYTALNQIASRAAIGSEGVRMFPFVNGTLLNPHFKAAFLNMSSSVGVPELIRSGLEGIACEMVRKMTAIEEKTGRISHTINVVGGISKSEIVMQTIADASGKKLAQSSMSSEHAGTLGAAMIAGTGVGIFNNMAEAAAGMVHKTITYRPIPEHEEEARMLAREYQRLYHDLNSHVCGKQMTEKGGSEG